MTMIKEKVTIIVKGFVEIHNVDKYFEQTLKQAFSIENPAWHKLVKMKVGGAQFGWGRFFEHYIKVKNQNLIMIGRGGLKKLLDLCKANGYEVGLRDGTVKVPLKNELKGRLELRDYQKDIPELITKSNGILKLDTGFGKTLISLKLIEKYQQKTLIVVPRSHLLENYLTEIGKYYDIIPGKIQGEYNSVGEEITIATIQTLQSMFKKGELEKFRNTFGMVIADEVQGYVTLKARKVFGSFNAHYLFGLSATPERTDGQGDAIFLTFGEILVERQLQRSLPKVKVISTNTLIPVREYADMVEYMVNDFNRNSLIVDTVIEQVKRGRKVMILTKRVDHIKNLVGMFNGKNINVIPFFSTKVKDNNKLFKRLKESCEPYNVLIGTFSLLGTGSDVPNLDTLAIAGDLVSGVLTKQSVGRCTRLFEGKQDPLILDFYDNQNIIFHRQYKHRCKLYADNGWQVGQ